MMVKKNFEKKFIFPSTESTRMSNFKSNKQFYSLVLLKIATLLSHFCAVGSDIRQNIFQFLKFGPNKKVKKNSSNY